MGIVHEKIPECVAMLSSRESSQSRDQIQVSHIVGRYFTIWALREAQKKLLELINESGKIKVTKSMHRYYLHSYVLTGKS